MSFTRPTGRFIPSPSDFEDHMGYIEPCRVDYVSGLPMLELAMIDCKSVIKNLISLMKLDDECHVNKECGRIPDLWQAVKDKSPIYMSAVVLGIEKMQIAFNSNKIPSAVLSFDSLPSANNYLKFINDGLRDKEMLSGKIVYIAESNLECLFNIERTVEKLRNLTSNINITISTDPNNAYDCEIREFSPELLDILIGSSDKPIIDQVRSLPVNEIYAYRCLPGDGFSDNKTYHWKGTPHSYNVVKENKAGLPMVATSDFDFGKVVVTDAFIIHSVQCNEVLDPVDFISETEVQSNPTQCHIYSQLVLQWVDASPNDNLSRKRKNNEIEKEVLRSGVLSQLQWLRAVQSNIREREIPRAVVVPLYGSWYEHGNVHAIEIDEFPEIDLSTTYKRWYITVRDILINYHRSSPGEMLTATLARRIAPGTDDNIIKIHEFLSKWGLLNYKIHSKGYSSEISPSGFDRAVRKLGRQNSSSGSAWAVEEKQSLLETALDCSSASELRSKVKSDVYNQDLARTSSECLAKYASMEIEKFPIKSAGSLKGTQALEMLVARASHFLNNDSLDVKITDSVLQSLGETTSEEETTTTVSNLAAATLGICQAKALVLAEEERANLEALLLKALHLQTKKLQLQVSLLESSTDESSKQLKAMPHKWLSMYQEKVTRKVQLTNLLEEDSI